MTNFERASHRMRSQGYRPFTPYDTHNSRIAQPSPMRGRPCRIYGDSEPPALRIDVIIVLLAIGVALGMFIK